MGSFRLNEFRGTSRFEVVRPLGAGGMGVVYEALDREQGVRVALKTLRAPSPSSILRLKREFRALQDIQHPNLVTLGQLIEDAGRWFFTMELIQGGNFLEYVRPGWRGGEVSPSEDTLRSAAVVGASGPDGRAGGFDEGRLRAAFTQLASGLVALHEAGKVHRDIKPTNILVTGAGRVVLLDFGLVTDVEQDRNDTDGNIVGTAVYMAPEQALGEPVGPEADCYGAGVVLYEALVGAPPFRGPSLRVLMDKQRLEPPRPSTVARQVPEDLEALCLELLRYKPSKRPSSRAVVERLGGSPGPSKERYETLSSVHTQHPLFVGRDAELAQLAAALADCRRSRRQITVYVGGDSGIGKSALVRAFADQQVAAGGADVLAGRCYERETVPFKAFDGVIDALARHAQKLPEPDAAALTPRWASLLLQVFPVLGRVEAFAAAPRHDVLDGAELRTRLFDAVRELVMRLAERKTLIVVIDDLQWADADSLALLHELVKPPDAPPFLLLASLRDTGGGDPGVPLRLKRLPTDVRHVEVGGLPPEAAVALARNLLDAAGGPATLAPEDIAREAGGHPLFVAELVRFAVLHDASAAPFRLEDVLAKRISWLAEPPRRVLELCAIAGAPLAQDIIAGAAALDPGELPRVASLLRVANLVQTAGARGSDRIEPYHDRVRQTVLSLLDAGQRRSLHGDLARALESSGRGDFEALAIHYRGAGDHDRAAHFAEEAAAVAMHALAFDRAAGLYRLAIDLVQAPARVRTLHASLGDALAKAGRGADAAAALVSAAKGATAGESLALRGRAAQQLLVAGHIDVGIRELRQVLASEGIGYPKTPLRALLAIVRHRGLLALRGLGFRRQDESQVPVETLARIDLQYYAGTTLNLVDPIRAQALHVAGVRLARRTGEPYRFARALAFEAGYQALAGGRAEARVDRLLAVVEQLAGEMDSAHLITLVKAVKGSREFFCGRFPQAYALCRDAEGWYRDRGLGHWHEIHNVGTWAARSLHYMGRVQQLADYLPATIRDCEDRGDLYLATTLRTSVLPFVHLAADDPDAAREEVDAALSRWSPQRFHVQHYYALFAQASADVYQGGAEARERLRSQWAEVRGSMLLRVQIIRTLLLDVAARASLAAAGASRAERGRLLREAERFARRIAAERMPWSTPLAHVVDAGVAGQRGNHERASELLEAAASGFTAASMAMHAAAARRARGTLVGGTEGARLIDEADAFLGGQKVRNPARTAALLAPGF